MDLFMNEPGRSIDTMFVKNKSDQPFHIVFDSKVTVIPPGGVFRVPSSHYSALTMQPESHRFLQLLDLSKGSAEYLESEKRRKVAEVEAKRKAFEQAQADLAASEQELEVSNVKLKTSVLKK